MEKKLAEIKADKKKIVLYMAMRLPWLALFGLAIFAVDMQRKGSGSPNYAAIGVMSLLMLIYVCSPLRHLADVLTYYENKIVFNKKVILFQDPSEINWATLRGRYWLLEGTRLLIKINEDKAGIKEIFFPSNEIDVTYMKTPKEIFIKCYLNQKVCLDEKMGEKSSEKESVRRILQMVVPPGEIYTPVYGYWMMHNGRNLKKCWYYAIGLTTEKMYIVPLTFAGKEIGYGKTMVLCREQIGSIDTGKSGGSIHFLKFMDQNQKKIFEVVVEESNTKWDVNYPVNMNQVEETREFMKKIQQWQCDS